MSAQSPRIENMDWGSIDTTAGSFRDAKLWPGGGRNWDWGETDTHHTPGVQPEDVNEVADHGAEVLVIGRGQQERLELPDGTREVLESRVEAFEVLESNAAVERYNELAEEGRPVGALIHTTC